MTKWQKNCFYSCLGCFISINIQNDRKNINAKKSFVHLMILFLNIANWKQKITRMFYENVMIDLC